MGEWHFHPQASPAPSSRDSIQMRDIARMLQYHCPEPILLMVGGGPFIWRISSYVYFQDGSNALLGEVTFSLEAAPTSV